jgi:pimeloyl-ACP methyl ester carboxylesterase
VTDGAIERPDGRTVAYVDAGGDGTPVLWCHGGPGSRFEPRAMAPGAADAGLRTIGIDRPGYGRSTVQPGRTIAGWVPDGLAVADAVGVERFAVVGVSTGGAYALATAALAPDRVTAVLACCALTDMRWEEGRAMVDGDATTGVWSAPDRGTALQLAAGVFGEDGSKLAQGGTDELPAADIAMFSDPVFLAGMVDAFPAMFAQGLQGYVDDRLADGPGWGSFDVGAVSCPVLVLHGSEDTLVPVGHAHHTAEVVPGARLRVVDGLAHLSISREIVGELVALLGR